MKCVDCGTTDIWAPKLKVREHRVRCLMCDGVYIFSDRFRESRGGITVDDLDEATGLDKVLAPVVEKAKKKVRVPETCEGCGFVEGPDATRADQVFERYGRLLCRRCRRKGRDGTARRRRPRKGG